MKEVKLSRGLTCFVDDEDYSRVIIHKWTGYYDGYNFYATRTLPRVENPFSTNRIIGL